MSCGVGCRCGTDPALLWLTATALILPLAWEPLHASGSALKRQKERGKKRERERENMLSCFSEPVKALMASQVLPAAPLLGLNMGLQRLHVLVLPYLGTHCFFQ